MATQANAFDYFNTCLKNWTPNPLKAESAGPAGIKSGTVNSLFIGRGPDAQVNHKY
jgi:hypothetical protein